jgi:hypothetical protein
MPASRTLVVTKKGPVLTQLLLFIGLLTTLASAQEYSGTYVAQADASLILTLTQGTGGTLSGHLAGPNGQLQLDGVAMAEGIGGVIYTSEGNIAFEGYLQGDVLSLYLIEFGPNMEPIMESVVELIMLRQARDERATPAPGPDDGEPASGLAPTPLRASALTGTPLAPGQQYASGTLLLSREAGASFVVPEGFVAVTAEGLPHPVLQDHARSAFALVGMQSGFSVNQLQTTLLEEQAIEEDALHPVGAPVVQGAQFVQRYAGAQAASYLGVVLGEAGNGVQVFLYGPLHEEAYLRSTLDALLASVRLGIPVPSAEVQRWRQELPGMMLKWLTSSDGVTASRVYHLCSDGSYRYEFTYVLQVAVPGVTGGQTEHDVHQGRWRMEAGGVGPVLVLDVSDGRAIDVGLYRNDGETYVDQTRYYRVHSDVCP